MKQFKTSTKTISLRKEKTVANAWDAIEHEKLRRKIRIIEIKRKSQDFLQIKRTTRTELNWLSDI